MIDFNLVPPVVGYVIAGVFGAIIGSFLNVVIHRVPLEESIVFPNSRCPSCGAVIAFYDNIPVLSYVLLGAKCRKCKEHISFRYPAVELLTAVLFVGIAWHDGLSAALPFDLVFANEHVAIKQSLAERKSNRIGFDPARRAVRDRRLFGASEDAPRFQIGRDA